MKKLIFFALFCFLCGAIPQNLHAQSILRVDTDAAAGGDGSTWALAYQEVQTAIDAASSGDEIWVAEGTYYPTRELDFTTDDPRFFSFYIPSININIYGGFDGSEVTRSERNIAEHECILSGDINGNDNLALTGSEVFNDANRAENVYHTVFVYAVAPSGGTDTNSVLNGFTIRGGNANSTGGQGDGGGIYINGFGTGNEASPVIEHCTFTANSANNSGGGGLIFGNLGTANPSFTSCIFTNNQGGAGGAMHVFCDSGTSNPSFTNCLFYENTSTGSGGAFFNNGNNSANSPNFTNCTFADNTANATGGVYFDFATAASGETNFDNCILWSNGNTAVVENASNSIFINHSIYDDAVVDGTVSFPTGVSGASNRDADPLFVDATNDDFSVVDCSPAIDIGENAAIPMGVTTDLAGNTRIVNNVDAGAYEFQNAGNPIIYVNKNVVGGNNDGSSWNDAFLDLQDGLDAAGACIRITEVWVAAGTYLPTETPDGSTDDPREKAFHLEKDMKIYGGFVGTETMLGERNAFLNKTILSGDFNVDDTSTGSGAALTLNGNSENAYHVLVTANLTNTSLIDGFTITGGNANGNTDFIYGSRSFSNSDGGGQTNFLSVPMILNCNFIRNAAIEGAGQYNNTNLPFNVSTMVNCAFSSNHATNDGGGQLNVDADPTLINCSFSNNVAKNGGAQRNIDAAPSLSNCVIWGNTASNSSSILNNGGNTTIAYSIVEGSGGSAAWDNNFGTDNGNNLDTDPFIVDATNDNLSLSLGSPAIDAGDNSAVPVGITTDLASDTRIRDGIVDMGAYEWLTCPIGKRVYVDMNNNPDPNNGGSNWDKAYLNLQDAIDVASTCSSIAEIWVAQGTYLPTESPDGSTANTRDQAFHLDTDMKIYGGFLGNETILSERNPSTNITLLSGDFNSDDVVTGAGSTLLFSNNSENAYHVMVTANLTNAAVIDGFTFSGGNANDGSGSSMTYSGQTFIRRIGGGQYNIASALSMSNCTLTNNFALSLGGGQYNIEVLFPSSPANFTNCNFTYNSSDNGGGGQYNSSTLLDMTDCTISYNRSINEGGGQYNRNNSTLNMSNCNLSSNASNNGAGQYNSASSVNMISCTILDNMATFNGGGQLNFNVPSPSMKNCLIANNTAGFNGGGQYNQTGATTEMINCTITQNGANIGGGLYNDLLVNATIKNSIIWSNTASTSDPSIFNDNSTPTFAHSIVEASGGSTSWNMSFGTDNGNNLDTDPIFIDPLNNDFHLCRISPAIDVGDNTAISGVNTDLAGNARIDNNTVDMGAYEYQSINCSFGERIYVNVNNSTPFCEQDGSTWEKAFTNLQDAIDAASTCPSVAEVWVAQGTYLPTESPDGSTTDLRDRAFHLSTDMKIYGGFVGTENSLSERNSAVNSTILSGDFSSNDNFILNDDGNFSNDAYQGTTGDENAYHVMMMTNLSNSSIIDGFTFTGGNANGSGSILYDNGTFIKMNGGGLYSVLSGEVISNCIFTKNNAASAGGGQRNESSGNTTINCLFYLNTSSGLGGGMSNDQFGSHSITNCTFTFNQAADKGGGQSSTLASDLDVSNSILWGNIAGNANPNIYSEASISPVFKNNIVQASGGSTSWDNTFGTDAGNNLDTDPLFVDTANGDFSLQVCSPAINAGDTTGISITSTDLASKPRIQDGTIDIGAYERQDLTLPDLLGIASIQASDSLFTGADTIQTFGTVTVVAADTIIFEGAKAVVLKVGFSAVAGSNFTARIGQCGVPAANNLFSERIVEERSEESNSTEELKAERRIETLPSSLTAYPNPFKETTTIEFELGTSSNVQLSVFDLQGRMIQSLYQGTWLDAGQHRIQMEATDWKAGMYLIRMQTAEEVVVKQLILQR